MHKLPPSFGPEFLCRMKYLALIITKLSSSSLSETVFQAAYSIQD